MAKVLIASWASLGGEDISVTLRNLKGDELCSLQMPNATVRDLELRLLDPKGPLQNHFCSPILNFYTVTETSKELDPRMKVSQLNEEFYIHESAVGIWLEKWPDTGKTLEAMYYSKFHPASPNFDVKWTADTVPKVPPREALILVKEVLNGSPSDTASQCRFVQIFGTLTAQMESWMAFNLKFLRRLNFPNMLRFKHVFVQHYVDLARFVATSMVSTDRLPAILVYWGQGCNVLGHDWPWPIMGDQDMQQTLQLVADMRPGFAWEVVSRTLRFWEFQEDEVSLVYDQEPAEFRQLQPDEILQMVHVQLRLSCCNVAEVQGPLNKAAAVVPSLTWPTEVCAQILAELLFYELKVLKYENATDFDAAIQVFDQEIEPFLVLVTNLPATCRGHIFAGRHRMILCYDPDVEPPAKRPRYRLTVKSPAHCRGDC